MSHNDCSYEINFDTSLTTIHSLKEKKTMRVLLQTLLMFLLTAVIWAQDSPTAAAVPSVDHPLSADNRSMYGGVKQILMRSAQQMSEDDYNFKPADGVRTYGQILGHIADSQYLFCSAALGEKNPAPKVEKTKTSKTDLVNALKDAFAYCDKAYDAMTDVSAAETVKFMGRDKPRLGVLSINNVHTIEHYGNLTTYMRMKNVIPPTSDAAFMRQLSADVQEKKK